MSIVRRAVTVTGRVQGVSFRYHTGLQANRLALTGWVRNHEDGSVRLEVQGPEEDVDALVRWLRLGPPSAVVDHVAVETIDPKAHEDGFRAVR